MLTPADIITAKLTVQLKYAGAKQVRKALRETAEDPQAKFDVLDRLARARRVDRAQYQAIRRFVALYEFIRYEAVFLTRIERSGRAKDEVYDLMARADANGYRRRLGDLMVGLGQLTTEEAAAFEKKTLKAIRKEDARILKRYIADDYQGVARPLIPRPVVNDSVFRIALLFRTEDTQAKVARKLKALETGGEENRPALETLDPDAPPDEGVEVAQAVSAMVDSVVGEDTVILDTARLAEEVTIGRTKIESVGPYTIVQPLGAGAMGAVYLATGPQGMVAMKVLEAKESEELARFQREAMVLAKFEHPHLMRLIDRGEVDGVHYIVFPAVAGESLRAQLDASEAGLAPELAFDLFQQLLLALQYVHENRVVHRDLKPANILVVAGVDTIKVVDFGLARPLEEEGDEEEEEWFKTAIGAITGSPAYIAPETISGGKIDGRTDVYSLGIVFYEMLTKSLPFKASSPYGYLREHLVGTPATLSEARRDVYWCPDLEKLIGRMLAKEKDDRPHTCAGILAELRGGLREKALAEIANPPHETKAESQPSATGLFNRFFKKLGG